LWATGKDKSEIIPVLREASERVVGQYTAWQELPELQEISNDAHLLKAAGLLQKIDEKIL
jgi:hypothetical protein